MSTPGLHCSPVGTTCSPNLSQKPYKSSSLFSSSQKSSISLPSNLIQTPNNSPPSNLSEKTNNSSPFNLSQNYNNSPPSNLSEKTNNSSPFNFSQNYNNSPPSNLSEKTNNSSPFNLSQKTNNSSFLSSNSQKSNSTSSSNKSSFSRPSSPLPHPSSDCKGGHINGAIPIPNGKFRNPEDVFSLMLSESPSGKEVPRGIKEDVLFVLNNEANVSRQARGGRAFYADDCGVWSNKAFCKTNHYILKETTWTTSTRKTGCISNTIKVKEFLLNPNQTVQILLCLNVTIFLSNATHHLRSAFPP